MSQDWYRSREWNPDVARRFDEKLRRARSKDQYLRIQAACLVDSHPEVALRLVERFFDLEDPFTPAQALDVKARALTRLGRIEEAWSAYESVLAAEQTLPSVRTNAFADMSVLAVTHGLTHHYDRVLEILSSSTKLMTFPVLGFINHACRAIILESRGMRTQATQERHSALQLASLHSSGLPNHRELGLVGEQEAPLLRLLQGFRDA